MLRLGGRASTMLSLLSGNFLWCLLFRARTRMELGVCPEERDMRCWARSGDFEESISSFLCSHQFFYIPRIADIP
jgi:hypothetical protein